MPRAMRKIISLSLCGIVAFTSFVSVLPSVLVGVGAIDDDGVDSASIWSNATFLEQLGSSHPAYRCAGSVGANASADWVLDRFHELGLKAWSEEFEFYGWDMVSMPSMEVTFRNGSEMQTLSLSTFQAEQFSCATPPDGSSGEIVLLPLPSTSSYSSFTGIRFDGSLWQNVDIHGKIVVVGREIRWNQRWEESLRNKLEEGPAALVFYYSQTWTSQFEVMFSASSGGRPLSILGSYLADGMIPSGHLDIMDSEWLLGKMSEGNVTAKVSIDSKEGIWKQRNVVACLEGEDNDSNQVVLSAHYDSVMDGGFCDNALSVATMIEVAAQLQRMAREEAWRPAGSLLFVAFTGEELGLVGSDHYFARHASEVEDYRAVLNVDCLGAGYLVRTGTDEYLGMDLDQIVDQAATKLGITTTLEEGGSDHQSFLYPYQVASQIRSRWGVSPSITPNAVPLPSSISLSSIPLTPIEPHFGGMGWIHTMRDASSYCSSSGWVSPSNIKVQGDVVLAVCLELVGTAEPPVGDGDPIPATAVLFVVIASAFAVAMLALSLRHRRPPDK